MWPGRGAGKHLHRTANRFRETLPFMLTCLRGGRRSFVGFRLGGSRLHFRGRRAHFRTGGCLLWRGWREHGGREGLLVGRRGWSGTVFRLVKWARRMRGRWWGRSGRASRRRRGGLGRHWTRRQLRRRPGSRRGSFRRGRRAGCRSGRHRSWWCRSTGRLVARRLTFLRRWDSDRPRRCLRGRLVRRLGRSVLRRRNGRPHRPGARAGRRLPPTWRGRGRSVLSLLGGLTTRRRRRRRWPRGAAGCSLWRPAGRLRRGAHPKKQSRPVLGIADSDGLAVADVDRRHPRALDVDAVAALVDCHPVVPSEPQHEVDGLGPAAASIIEADVRTAIVADRDIAARPKRVTRGSNPNGQRGSERLAPHGPPPFITGHIVPIDGCLPVCTIIYPTARCTRRGHRRVLMA